MHGMGSGTTFGSGGRVESVPFLPLRCDATYMEIETEEDRSEWDFVPLNIVRSLCLKFSRGSTRCDTTQSWSVTTVDTSVRTLARSTDTTRSFRLTLPSRPVWRRPWNIGNIKWLLHHCSYMEPETDTGRDDSSRTLLLVPDEGVSA